MDDTQIKAIEQLLIELQAILVTIKAEAGTKEPPQSPFDAKVFFDTIRPLFGGKLTASQVQGTEAKLKAFEGKLSLSHCAYALATSFHETAHKMQPVREGLNASDSWRRKNLRYYPYYGRGDVQLTWRENYARADRELGLGGALLANLDLALDPDISARVMVRGMEEGWFSKDKKGVPYNLARFLPNNEETLVNFRHARRIINGTDRAADIAGYAIKFQDALRAAGWR